MSHLSRRSVMTIFLIFFSLYVFGIFLYYMLFFFIVVLFMSLLHALFFVVVLCMSLLHALFFVLCGVCHS